MNFDEMCKMHSDERAGAKTHRFTLNHPSSFRQLLATGKRKGFTQKMRMSTFKKNKKALQQYKNEKRMSVDLELVKSKSTPKMVDNQNAKFEFPSGPTDEKKYSKTERTRKKQLNKMNANIRSNKNSISSHSAYSHSQSASQGSPDEIKHKRRHEKMLNEIRSHIE